MIYKIYVPKQGNDGKPFDFQSIVKQITQISDGFTVYDGQGYWQGIFEPVWIFEIVTDKPTVEDSIKDVLGFLKVVLNQQAMFYTKTETGQGVLV